jgi:hypothetical protein
MTFGMGARALRTIPILATLPLEPLFAASCSRVVPKIDLTEGHVETDRGTKVTSCSLKISPDNGH